MPELDLARSTLFAWTFSAHEAGGVGAPEIAPVHLLLGLTKLADVDPNGLTSDDGVDATARAELVDDVAMLRSAFDGLDVETTTVRRAAREELRRGGAAAPGKGVIHRDHASRSAFTRAGRLAEESRDTKVRPVHLLTILVELDVLRQVRALIGRGKTIPPEQGVPRGPAPDQALTPPPSTTPFLDRFGRDLTAQARAGTLEPVIGRRDEMRSLAQALMQQRKRSAILVGEAGVGKTGVVEGLAQRLAGGDVPEELADARIVELQIAALVAGTVWRGEFEERVQKVLEEASANPNVILFIDEIHTLLGAGGRGASDAANIVKPALARGEIRVIGATTIDEYRRHVEADPALERRFATVQVEEPTVPEAIEILSGLRGRFLEHHGVEVSDEAIAAAVELAVRFLPDRRLPDKAIDIIDQALAVARLGSLSLDRRPPVPESIGRAQIAAAVAQRARVPVERVGRDEAQRLLTLEDTLSARVAGQPEAVRAAAEAVRTARAGLKDPRRPVAVLLFAGPTGTGKTELAKALCNALFDDERHLIRLDMSEYKERHSVSRLIGPPPGYVGFDAQEGELTGPIRSHPYSVVLFDEIEKAHPEVLDLLLQVFDDGRLTDTRGRTASFREAVIILTTNLGASEPGGAGGGAPIGFAPAVSDVPRPAPRARVDQALAQALRPELLNRVQKVVVFDPLDRETCRLVLERTLAGLAERLRERHDVTIALSDEAAELLIDEGFDQRFGARELERVVGRRLVEPLATALLREEIPPGAAVRVEVSDGALRFAAGGTSSWQP